LAGQHGEIDADGDHVNSASGAESSVLRVEIGR
jgi:hypothetical protein